MGWSVVGSVQGGRGEKRMSKDKDRREDKKRITKTLDSV